MSDHALIVVDVQNDFCPGGALAVNEGDEIVPLVNELMSTHSAVILTQDWHPVDHLSFASQHEGREPYETIEMPYGPQTLWPDHCVQGTYGAEFHPGLYVATADLVIRKGFRKEIDSYSTFFENDGKTQTGLAGYLRERGLSKLRLAGIATDFCVAYSALDAIRLGFSVEVILEASRGIDLNGSVNDMIAKMREAGVVIR